MTIHSLASQPKARRGSRLVALVYYRVLAELEAESQRTYVGFLWWIVEPLLSLAVFYLVFSVVLGRGGPGYVAFLFCGIVPWRWFQSTILRGSASILSARGLMQQVYFPKAILPLVSIAVDTTKYLVVLALLVVATWLLGYPPSVHHLGLLPIVAVQGLFVGALTLLTAGAVPFLPDLKLVLQNLMRLWFFLSGVFYEVATFPEPLRTVLRWNPMVAILDSYRRVLIERAWAPAAPLTIITLASCVIGAVALFGLRRLDLVYPKLRF